MKYELLLVVFLIFNIPSFSQTPNTQESGMLDNSAKVSETFIDNVSSNDPMVRRQAIIDMAQTRDVKYVDVIEKYINDENKLVSMAAIESLGTMRSQKSAGKITELLSKTADNDIKNSCIIALSYMPKIENPQPLINIALNDKDENLRASAIRTLGAFNIGDIEEEAINAISDKKSSLKLKISYIDYLGAIKSKKSALLLIKFIKDENLPLRVSAIRALGDIGEKTAIESLRIISGENIPEVQIEAAYSLAKMGDNFALNSLYKYLDSDNQSYKNMAINIIGIIGDSNSINVLNKKIEDEKNPSFKSFMEFAREKISARLKREQKETTTKTE